MDKNNRLKKLKDIVEAKKGRQLTLQEKWQIDAELAKERKTTEVNRGTKIC
ncbi:hypothetical protein 355Saur083PP_00006 [Staphylococcus phage 355Saur083PP]|nr:hypothetical protein 355Saur083PP_00006 [Staphylococcus phage 355Saur083PP]